MEQNLENAHSTSTNPLRAHTLHIAMLMPEVVIEKRNGRKANR